MSTHLLDEVLQLLQSGGADAHRRDWALGRTVVVRGGARSEKKGIVVWERVVWVVDGGGCSVVHPNHGTLGRGLPAREAARIALAALGDGWSLLQAAALPVTVVQPLAVRGRGYVLVDVLDSEHEFDVDAGATLDGCPLEPWLDQPRALDNKGQQIAGRFALVLRNASDIARFAPDQVRVFLPGVARSASGLANPG